MNVVDWQAELIEPHALERSLLLRRPKVVTDHDWARPVGKVLDTVELFPEDCRLPSDITALGGRGNR